MTTRREHDRAAELFDSAEAILADLDGTLVYSEAPVRRAWTAFAARHGLDPEQVLAFAQGRPSSETVGLLAPAADHDIESRLLEQSEVNDTDGIIAVPGALELLSDRRPVAIVTSCSRALAKARLSAAGLPEPVVMVTFDDVEHGKPDPECFLLGARRLGVAPERCVVMEDSPTGITAAARAGATVIALRTTHADDELGGADAIVDDLRAIRRS